MVCRRTEACSSVLDGAKALHKACRDVFGDRAFIQRCQEHKKRYVADHLPESMRPGVRRAMNQAYECRDAKRAKCSKLSPRVSSPSILALPHPCAKASSTLTVIELNLPERLQLSLRTTNPIDKLIGSVRKVSRRVKRWRGGRMMLRWCGAAVLDAEQRFRRIRGYREMPKLIAALRAPASPCRSAHNRRGGFRDPETLGCCRMTSLVPGVSSDRRSCDPPCRTLRTLFF